ncbi:helix-turn-helix domain-containing protein, partial [Streptomyces sp. NPDC059080]|uniref:helix-turn-helix domain-containing protein n=1 Tax=Streptomyces sp. NPDC059080 TaxID=3346718 RepID=UPI00369B7C46
MPRWRALPEELEPEIRDFVRQLRGVVDRAGLSVSDVAEQTGTPRADWVRHLDGRQPPPREAVAALARVAGVPAAHLAAMGEDAAAAWRHRAERGDGPPGDGARGGHRRRTLLAAGAGGALLVVAAAGVVGRPGRR